MTVYTCSLTGNDLHTTEYPPKMYVRSPPYFMSMLGIQDKCCFVRPPINMLSIISGNRGNHLSRMSDLLREGLFSDAL